MSNKISTIIFDLGGVLFSDGSSKIGNILEKEKGYDSEKITAIIKSEKRKEALRGLITDEEFWLWAKEQLPPEYDIEYIEHAYYDSYKLDKDILNLLITLKNRGYSLFVFSGNMRARVEYLEDKYCFSHHFDKTIYSFDVKATKPDQKFFEALRASLGSKIGEAILIDDKSENLDYIKENYGMNIALYQEGLIENLKNQLRLCGIKC